MRRKTDDAEILLKMSRSVGCDPELVGGAGGNTSIKCASKGTMLVKASGTTLAAMERGKGYVEVRLDAVLDLLNMTALKSLHETEREEEVKKLLAAACTSTSPPGRPSVETILHAQLDRCVVHTHPALVCGLLASRRGVGLLADKDVLVVPYVDPGYPLAALMAEKLAEWRRTHRGRLPQVILMENHGLIATAAEPETALALTRRMLARAKRLVKSRPSALPSAGETTAAPVDALLRLKGALCRVAGSRCVIAFRPSERTVRLLKLKNAASLLSTPLVPDQVAFSGLAPLVVRKEKALCGILESYIKRHGTPPKIALLPGSGYAAVGTSPEDAANKADIWRDVERMFETALTFGGVRSMCRRDAEYVASWEAEKYRMTLHDKAGGLLKNRTALVTGAGSGLGRAIALGFLRAGALVAFVDVSSERLADALGEAEKAVGAGRAVGITADVTDEAAVRGAFQKAVLALGGLDVLVNAAGIAPSYPLVDFPADAWRRALELNLTGYFLAAREAARLMILQGIGGSIINVSSKTGLDASRNNSAYNATKAGEIHLGRGWALDLGEHGIRVNAIAPGNVFRGSLIWNRKYIEACAKKRGIKPEDVIPYYVNLTALKKELQPEDVANVAVFLASDMADKITGQTIVPDGGQVFVR
ncbi:MAG TPA: SDR family oxidoreductase [Planctomycetes bacterium]|nr:SDR family oxidoreductase [Planctomycetota bacterium]